MPIRHRDRRDAGEPGEQRHGPGGRVRAGDLQRRRVQQLLRHPLVPEDGRRELFEEIQACLFGGYMERDGRGACVSDPRAMCVLIERFSVLCRAARTLISPRMGESWFLDG